jgi:hypothetical protein
VQLPFFNLGYMGFAPDNLPDSDFFFILLTWGSRQITSRTLTLCASGLKEFC